VLSSVIKCTYRRVGQALRLSERTVYRWLSAWGYEWLPVAALFGLVRSSAVAGLDAAGLTSRPGSSRIG
jgi:hypothetical protein